jgi:hypothetical protein
VMRVSWGISTVPGPIVLQRRSPGQLDISAPPI